MQNEVVKVNSQDVTVKEFKGQRVVTLKDIDAVHERSDGTARRNFNTNRKHLIKGEDYFVRNSSEAQKEFGITAPNGLVLLTESGYLMLVKSFTDDLAWTVQRQLVRNYFQSKKQAKAEKKAQTEHLASVNNAVKILTPLLKQAGCTAEIQLLTAKSLYEKAGVSLPIEIQSDRHYVDTVHIARHVGLYYQSSGKPADKAVNEIIRRLDLPESMYTETWESKGNWQGAVRKYDEAVIGMVREWYCENGYPREIEYIQCDGQTKRYHVVWRDAEVA